MPEDDVYYLLKRGFWYGKTHSSTSSFGDLETSEPPAVGKKPSGVIEVGPILFPPRMVAVVRVHRGVPQVEATSCTVKSVDDRMSTSSRVNAAHRPFQTPEWATFTDNIGDPPPLGNMIFKLDFLRYAELETSDVYFYQFQLVEEMVRRAIKSQSLFHELIPYGFLFKAFGAGVNVPLPWVRSQDRSPRPKGSWQTADQR